MSEGGVFFLQDGIIVVELIVFLGKLVRIIGNQSRIVCFSSINYNFGKVVDGMNKRNFLAI